MISYPDLVEFLEKKMRMSAHYQPTIIKNLLYKYPNQPTVQFIARKVFPSPMPFSQAVDRCKKMPFKVLKSHGVIAIDNPFIYLDLDRKLSTDEQQLLIGLCNQKLKEFNERKKK